MPHGGETVKAKLRLELRTWPSSPDERPGARSERQSKDQELGITAELVWISAAGHPGYRL